MFHIIRKENDHDNKRELILNNFEYFPFSDIN